MKAFIKNRSFFLLSICFSACAQSAADHNTATNPTPSQPHPTNTLRSFPGGACPDCNLMFLGMPLLLSAVDTTPGWFEAGQKLKIEGTIFQPDQKTPAPDVIVYFYHTDQSGRYIPVAGIPPSARKHGRMRGWVKTGPDGRYTICTNRPAQSPDGKVEAHILAFVKEPYVDVPYMIDEWIFDDDPLVTKELRSKIQNQGGNPILKTERENDVQMAKHDIILGLNIPGYPK